MRKRIRFCFLLLVLPLALQQGTQLESLAQPPAEEKIGQETENGAERGNVEDELLLQVRTECPEAAWEEEDRKYYGGAEGETEQIVLVFEAIGREETETASGQEEETGREEAGQEEPDQEKEPDKLGKPELAIRKDGHRMDPEETKDWISWSFFEDGGDLARITLPYEAGQEICYQVEAVWQNEAGDPLRAAEGSFGGMEDEKRGIFVTGDFFLDARAPELLDFTAKGDCVQLVDWENGSVPLFRNKDGADLRVSFTIDDGGESWSPEALQLQLISLTDGRTAVELDGNSEAFSWIQEGRRHRAELELDGETGREGIYQLQLRYQDRTGHPLCGGQAGEEDGGILAAVEEGVCMSTPFALDHAAPLLYLGLPEASTALKNGQDCDASEIHTADCTFYYKEDLLVEILLRDPYMVPSGEEGEPGAPEHFCLKLWQRAAENPDAENPDAGNPDAKAASPEEIKDVTKDVTKQISWSRLEDGGLKGSLTVPGEGGFRILASYEDLAGNPAQAENTVGQLQGSMEDGSYESPLLVLDKTAPVVSIAYTETPAAEYQGRKYFDRAVNLRLTVEDRNFRVQELKEILESFTAVGSGGEERKEETALAAFLASLDGAQVSREVWSVELPLHTDANYTIPVSVTDLAGNQAEVTAYTECLTVDTKPPEGLELTYPGGTPVNYLPSGWIFSGEPFTLQAAAGDETAGIREIRFVVTGEDGTETVRTHTFAPAQRKGAELSLPLEGSDFKGTVRMEICDWAGNRLVQERNAGVESQKRHETTMAAQLETVTRPSRTVDGVDYYNTDVVFRVNLRDEFSGLREVSYSGGRTLSGGRDYAKEAGSGLEAVPEQELTYEFSQQFTLEAAANHGNAVPVRVSFTDNAGHTESLEQRYHIDVAAPEITVEYDLKEPVNGRYFRQPRTATVTIRERNFDERDVEFRITSPEGALPEISGWTSSGTGDDTLHRCTIVFEEDGDYTFTAAFQDLAGNRADYERTDVFTIDRTAPELTVSWDNTDSRHDIYYKESRTAVIEILEHNFDPERFRVEVGTERKDGGTAKETAKARLVLLDWRQEGDRYTASVTFSEDGISSLKIEGEDLAGNPAAAYDSGLFVIDQTPPDLEISGVSHRSANQGEVRPAIRYTDENIEMESLEISLRGYRNGENGWSGQEHLLADGAELCLDDLAHTREQDDMYTLKASVQDLAGNRSEEQISFSVNRFGSVYTFDEKTERLAGQQGVYFTKQEQELVITETNVDTLEFQEIVCNHNGQLRTLEEGVDYTVKEDGGFPGWKQYTYTIGRKNFQEEGSYILTIYSEDRAGNMSDTGSKGKRLEFAVDKTAPVILASGAEDGGRYRESAREITLDIQDNLQLEEAVVTLNGERIVYSGADLAEQDGRLVLRVEGENYWQELSVTARDAAGNTAETLKLRLLVTPNLLVQLVTNRTLCYSIAGVLGLLAAAAACVLHARARQAEEEEGNRQRRKAGREKDL